MGNRFEHPQDYLEQQQKTCKSIGRSLTLEKIINLKVELNINTNPDIVLK